MYSRLKLMFCGDSITVGTNSTETGGYRARLWDLISARLMIAPFDCGWDSRTGLGQDNCCATSGHTTEELLANVLLQAPAFQPEVIFLHIGTNDRTQLGSGAGTTTTEESVANVSSMLDAFREANPTCIVFLAKIIGNQTYNALMVSYNAALDVMVTARNDRAYIELVDMYTAFGAYDIINFQNGDPTHPSYYGYNSVMAPTWYTSFITRF